MFKKEKSKSFVISVPILIIALVAIVNHFQPSRTLIRGVINLENTKEYKTYLQSRLYTYLTNPTWNPTIGFNLENQPQIAGKASILVELNSGKVLAEKNADEKREIASLVKVMTAIVALEHKNLSDEIEISKEAASVGENTMGLTENEIYTLEELLYGLILHSGNDAAYAIAESVVGDKVIESKTQIETFTTWMNIKAKELGLKNTYFADPSGLDDASYSTPRDLVKLTRYALKNPTFREIIKTVDKELVSEKHKYVYLYNQTNLLTTYPGVYGVKTGYTEKAGLCLITYAQKDGVELVGVVLNSIDRRGDMIRLLDHGFSSLKIEIQHNLL